MVRLPRRRHRRALHPRRAALSGALIGGTLFLFALVGGPLTGAPPNPARWLAPAFASGTNSIAWASLWLYIVGPLLGGILAAFLFMGFKGRRQVHLVASQPPPAQPAAPPPPI